MPPVDAIPAVEAAPVDTPPLLPEPPMGEPPAVANTFVAREPPLVARLPAPPEVLLDELPPVAADTPPVDSGRRVLS
jgi:hypothetical protein